MLMAAVLLVPSHALFALAALHNAPEGVAVMLASHKSTGVGG